MHSIFPSCLNRSSLSTSNTLFHRAYRSAVGPEITLVIMGLVKIQCKILIAILTYCTLKRSVNQESSIKSPDYPINDCCGVSLIRA